MRKRGKAEKRRSGGAEGRGAEVQERGKVESREAEKSILGVFLGRLQTEACNYKRSGLYSGMSEITEI